MVRDFVSAQDTHGMDVLGESKLVPSVTKTAQKESADQFLANYFSNPKETFITALGPLTNIAQALSRNSKLGKHCHRFVSMGGSFKSHGNCSPVAEYNYWCDPHAADKVFQDLGRKVEMVGLDVTRQIVLDPNRVAYMSRINPEMTAFISAITAFYNDFHWQYEHLIGCVINDPLALAYFLEPSICQGFDSYTEIVTQGPAMGQSIVDQANFYQKKANSHVLTRVETSLFWEDFMATILEAPHHHIRQDIDTLKLG
ncbi:pyrimidine-specific ribonucleoside hydrolase RihB [Streptococcus dysgalactiae]|nr:pyrimidine-specific ribonucleoside hydrolase RihB [Streptococcus dysgalactiae]